MGYLGIGLKSLAMLDELLSLVSRPFELANLCQLGTNLSDYVNGIRPESFYMLGQHPKFIDTDDRSILETLGADNKQK